MKAECRHEVEVLGLLCSDGWPGLASPTLRQQHVDECPSCAGSIAAVTALQRERERAVREASVPSAGLVWWRAQRRKQLEAARHAQRPILVAQWIGLVAVLAGAVIFVAQWSPSLPALGGIVGQVLEAPQLNPWWPAVVATMVAVVVLPIVLLVALAQD